MLRLMESLEYEKDDATNQKVEAMAAQYVQSLKEMPPRRWDEEGRGQTGEQRLQIPGQIQRPARHLPPKVEIEASSKSSSGTRNSLRHLKEAAQNAVTLWQVSALWAGPSKRLADQESSWLHQRAACATNRCCAGASRREAKPQPVSAARVDAKCEKTGPLILVA